MPLQPDPNLNRSGGSAGSSGDFDGAVEAWGLVIKADAKVDQMTETVNGLLGQLWQRSRQMMRIRQLAEHMSLAERPKDLGRQILDALYGELGCTRGVLWRLGEQGFEGTAALRMDELNLDNHLLPAPNPFPDLPILPFQSQWLDMKVLPASIRDLRQDPREELFYLPFEHQLFLSGLAVLVLPRGRIFSESEQEFMSVVQRTSALALHNSWLYRDLTLREEKLEALALHLHEQKEELAKSHSTLRDVESTRLAFISFAGEVVRSQLLSQLSYLRLLEDGACEEEERGAFLHGSTMMGSQMLEVLNDLVEWLRMAGGAPSGEPYSISLSPLLDELKAVLETFPAKPGVTVEWPYAEGVPEVIADPERLKQVLLNLLLRAQAGQEVGTIPFWIEREPLSLNLSLKLHMIGLDAAIGRAALSPRSFDPDTFFREGQVGAGLGLVMGLRLMKSMGGELRVDPTEGGSIISVDLPMA